MVSLIVPIAVFLITWILSFAIIKGLLNSVADLIISLIPVIAGVAAAYMAYAYLVSMGI